MYNEETIIDPQFAAQSKAQEEATKSVEQPKAEEPKAEESKAEEKKNLGWGEKAAYAAGGAVVGAGMTMAGQAVASNTSEKAELPLEEKEGKDAEAVAAAGETPAEEDGAQTAQAAEAGAADGNTTDEVEGVTVVAGDTTVHVSGNAHVQVENGAVHVSTGQAADPVLDQPEQAAPAPEDAIVATATGVRVAQVDDDLSFSQAFAEARAQVGPGGVFEWHGRAYGTYYKDEWDSMTTEQKHDFQASIDYKDVLSDDSVAQHYNDVAQHNASHHHYDSHRTATYDDSSESHHTPDHNVTETAHEYSSDDADVDVQVLEVGQTDLNGDGVPENAAVLDINGHEVLIVDIDRDGIADAAIADVDGDDQYEVADISGEHLAMPNQSAGDEFLAQTNDAPDYMNDANVGMYEA